MAISVSHLNVTIQANKILSDVGFEIAQSQTVGLLGPNGSGKSTLIRALAGLLTSSQSDIRITGEQLHHIPRRVLARKLAFVPQHADTEDMLSVQEIVSLGRAPHLGLFKPWTAEDNAAVKEAISLMQLEKLTDRLWHHLSGGERQRCQIARALAQKPDILLLDEPVNHLDIQFQLELMRLISSLPVTVVVALHDLNLAAKYCQHLVVLCEGRVMASGTPKQVITPELIHNVWQVQAEVNTSHSGRLNILYA